MNNDNIGIDPSLVETIETLDVPNNSTPAKETKTPKKGNSVIKKLLFTILIIALMGGIAYGLYYYLKLGTNHEKVNKIILKDIAIYEGQNLSNNISEYGVFEGVDIAQCTLDVNNVNTYIAGEYDYSVTCNGEAKIAKIIVNELLNVKTKLISKVKGDELNVEELIETNENELSFVDSESVNIIMQSDNTLNSIEVLVGSEKFIGYVLVYDVKPANVLECTTSDGKIVERIAFDKNKEIVGPILRITKNIYDSNEDYLLGIQEISEDKYTINTMNYSIDTIKEISKEDIGTLEEYTFSSLFKYYKSEEKGYACKF